MSLPVVNQVFIELQKIYAKLCELDSKLIITQASILFDSSGNLEVLTAFFDNLGTDPEPLIEAVISTQIGEFNSFMDELVTNAYIIKPDAINDCSALGVCGSINQINALLDSANNFVASPTGLNNLWALKILEIKTLLGVGDSEETLVNFTVPKFFDDKGSLVAGTDDNKIIIENPDNLEDLQELQTFLDDFLVKVSSVLDTSIRS